MRIILNNEKINLAGEQIRLDDLLKIHAPSSMFISKVNGKIVSKGNRKQVWLRDGDEIVLIPVLTGG